MSKSKTNTSGNVGNKLFGGNIHRDSYTSESNVSILSQSRDKDKDNWLECIKNNPKTHKEDCKTQEKFYNDSNTNLNTYLSSDYTKPNDNFQSDLIGDQTTDTS